MAAPPGSLFKRPSFGPYPPWSGSDTNVPLRSDFWAGVVGTVAAATGPYRDQNKDEVQKLRDVGMTSLTLHEILMAPAIVAVVVLLVMLAWRATGFALACSGTA